MKMKGEEMRYMRFSAGRFLSIIGLCWLLIMASCHSHQEEEDAWEILMPADSIELDMGLPIDLYLHDSLLFVVDYRCYDNFIQVFRMPAGQYLFSFVPQGDAYGKCMSASQFDFFTEDGVEKVSVCDFGYKILTYNLSTLLRDKNRAMPEREQRFWDEFPFIWNVYMTNDGYVASGKFYYERNSLIVNGKVIEEDDVGPHGGKFAIMNDSLQIIGYAGSLRPKSRPDIVDNVHNIANYGSQGLSPNRRYLADCISAAPILTLYELKDRDMEKKWEYVEEELDYMPTGISSFVEKNKAGYSHVSLTDELVYALLVGEAEDDEIGHFEREIHVFDIQSGEIVHKFLLDRPTRNIFVKDGKLYTIQDHQDAKVFVYDLP
ncbi:MAG: hypothetical protein J6U14_06175 [Bacteroidaceae bacterium]|nr:hypothetical protein [Bacteroidaceae bacterium]